MCVRASWAVTHDGPLSVPPVRVGDCVVCCGGAYLVRRKEPRFLRSTWADKGLKKCPGQAAPVCATLEVSPAASWTARWLMYVRLCPGLTPRGARSVADLPGTRLLCVSSSVIFSVLGVLVALRRGCVGGSGIGCGPQAAPFSMRSSSQSFAFFVVVFVFIVNPLSEMCG